MNTVTRLSWVDEGLKFKEGAIVCKSCGRVRVIHPQERQWYAARSLQVPTHCVGCVSAGRREAVWKTIQEASQHMKAPQVKNQFQQALDKAGLSPIK